MPLGMLHSSWMESGVTWEAVSSPRRGWDGRSSFGSAGAVMGTAEYRVHRGQASFIYSSMHLLVYMCIHPSNHPPITQLTHLSIFPFLHLFSQCHPSNYLLPVNPACQPSTILYLSPFIHLLVFPPILVSFHPIIHHLSMPLLPHICSWILEHK